MRGSARCCSTSIIADRLNCSRLGATLRDKYSKSCAHSCTERHRDDRLLDKWAQLDPFADDDGLHALTLPPLNPYILDAGKDNACRPDSVTLIKESVCRHNHKGKGKWKAEDAEPELVINKASMQVWYLGDCSLKSPRVNVNVLLLSPLVYNTPMNVILDFFATEWPAQVAAASCSFALSLNSGGSTRHFERLLAAR